MPVGTIVGVAGNVTRPSRTAALVEAIVTAARAELGGSTQLIELADAGPVLFAAMTPENLGSSGKEIVSLVESADLLVVGTPVYRASYTGALKHLFDLVGYEALAGKPVILAATGGSQLHALVTEHQLRPLFGFFRALTIPTAIYATQADFTDYRLDNSLIEQRIERAVVEAAGLIEASTAFAAESRRAQRHLTLVQ